MQQEGLTPKCQQSNKEGILRMSRGTSIMQQVFSSKSPSILDTLNGVCGKIFKQHWFIILTGKHSLHNISQKLISYIPHLQVRERVSGSSRSPMPRRSAKLVPT